jgi:glycosyltransferase involved in cell wall biosynthesis
MNLSLVIPVYNEEQNLPVLDHAIHKALELYPYDWEVIYIDDGSRDDSLKVLKELTMKDSLHLRIISFRRNFGQTAAISAGIDHASGEFVGCRSAK